MKGFSSKRIALEVDVLKDLIFFIYVCRCVRASFGPEKLHAGAVKGLRTSLISGVKFGSLYLATATPAPRSALLKPTTGCSISAFPNNGDIAASVCDF